METAREHHVSFKNAFSGLWYAFTSQPNFKIHFSISIAVIFLGLILGISSLEMTILILAIFLGLGAEMINTAIESMTDLITKDWQREAKIAKDVSAGMMLLCAFATMVAGLIILGPKLLFRLWHLF